MGAKAMTSSIPTSRLSELLLDPEDLIKRGLTTGPVAKAGQFRLTSLGRGGKRLRAA